MTMHPQRVWQWNRMLLLAVFVVLAGCGGAASGSTTPTGTSSHAGGNMPQSSGTSTVTLSLSGGDSGAVTLSVNPSAHRGELDSHHDASTQQIFLSIKQSDGQQFLFETLHYTGPGTYAIHGGISDEYEVEVVLHLPGNGNTLWLIDGATPGTCTATIASATPVPGVTSSVSGDPIPVKGASEVKGTITCPTLPSDLPTAAQPLTLTGTFDALMDER